MKYVQHTLTAAAGTVGAWATGGEPAIGGVLWAGYFIGREIAQAEYRWIEAFGGGLRANMGWFDRFNPKVWKTTDVLDWALPLAVAVVLPAIL